jgi:glutamate dehydrogenase/leucine dehydrogenase
MDGPQQGEFRDAEEVNRRREKEMVVANKAVDDPAFKNNVLLRQAGYILPAGRGMEAMKTRGWG